jgi:hypothetical protein
MSRTPDPAVFPLFSQTKPLRLKLRAGQALYIPPRWWHWVMSKERALAFNIWFPDPLTIPTAVLDGDTRDWHAPHVIEMPGLRELGDKWSDAYLERVIGGKDARVWIWRGSGSEVCPATFATFCRQDTPCYIITLDAYEGVHGNAPFKRLLQPDTVPFARQLLCSVLGNGNVQGHVNFWLKPRTSPPVDTGLHYDDDAGYLCVCDGIKEVDLYPPSETHLLYPHSLE